MNLWLQHLLVLLLVAACLAAVGWQVVRALAGRRSRLGQCCAKGCEPKPAGPAAGATNRVVFLPVEMLRKRR
jgi:hypothetical protein